MIRAALALIVVLVGAGSLAQREQASAGTTSPKVAKPRSGVRGRVTVYPTCGGPSRLPPDPRCGPAPLRVAIRIASARSGRTLRTVHSGADGRYRATLRPGSYLLTPMRVHGRALPSPPARARVRVRASHRSRQNFDYDSGLR